MSGEKKPAGPSWRPTTPEADKGNLSTSNRRKQLFKLTACLLALIGVVALLIFFLDFGYTPPTYLGLPIREFDARQLPPNPMAVQDCDKASDHFPDQREVAYAYQTGERLRQALAKLNKQSGKPIVIHLCALARTIDDEVYILPADAVPGPDGTTTWLTLKEVLAAVTACPARQKLLILDIFRPFADARLGILTDDVAEKVQTTLKQEGKKLPFWVLCACSPSQTAQVSEENGLSAFAYYIDQGLLGHADQDSNHQVSVKELAAFVIPRVDRWVWLNRGLRQEPMLVGKADDFGLVLFKKEALDPSEEKAADVGYPAWLKKGWELRDTWWKAEANRLAPLLFFRLEGTLLRVERRWRAAMDEKKDQKQQLAAELERDVGKMAEELQRIVKPRVPRSRSLALAAAGDPKREPLSEALRDLLRKAQDPSLKPEDVDKAKKKDFDEAKAGLMKEWQAEPFTTWASAVFEAAAKTQSLTPARLHALVALLQEQKDRAVYVETVFLNRLLDFQNRVTENSSWKWPDERVHQAVKTVHAAEEVLAEVAKEPAVLRWIADLLQQAEAQRREGEKALLEGRPSTWDKANQLLQQAEQKYQSCRSRVQEFRHGWQQLEQALVILPGLAPFLIAMPKVDPAIEQVWHEAAALTIKLSATLTSPSYALLADDPELPNHLRAKLLLLQQALTAKKEASLSRAREGTAEDYWELQALLESPLLNAKDREVVWQTCRELALRLHRQVAALDDADNPSRKTKFTSPMEHPGPIIEQRRKERRAAFAVGLLQLSGCAQAESLHGQLQAARRANEPAAWRTLGSALGQTWAKELPLQFQAKKDMPHQASRLGRLLTPYELELSMSTGEQYRSNLAAYWIWLGQRYQDESKLHPERTFYAEAAADYLRAP